MDFLIIFLLVTILYLVYQQRNAKNKTKANPHKLILDSCALIDGRIVELSRTGFVPEELIVPEFILHELQMLADGADAHKRERARFGLDVVKELQGHSNCSITIDHTKWERQPNDDKLVSLALKLGAALYTTDYNLSKLAEIKSVTVLNVNELAQSLRPVALPGEHKMVKILQKGSNPKQGVGYLEDGTMVVVDGAARLVGKVVEVEITRTHQTVAGKMLFGILLAANTVTRVAQKPALKLASRLRKPRKPIA